MIITPLFVMISTGLGRIEDLSPIEACVLANVINGEDDYRSTDPHAVIAAGVRELVQHGRAGGPTANDAAAVIGAPTLAEDIEAVRRAFGALGVDLSDLTTERPS